jgi:hypothetical protein
MEKKKHFKVLAVLAFLAVFVLLPQWQAASAAGLVPCGGPDEPACNLCWFFLMARFAIDFIIFKVVTAVSALLLVIAGVLFLFATEDSGRYETGKNIIKGVIYGYQIAAAGWVFINTFFMVIGVSEWSGLKDGWWKVKVTCNKIEDVVLTCPDGKVTGKEDCDPKETLMDCQSRTGYTVGDCKEMLSRCKADCSLEPKAVEPSPPPLPPSDDDNDDDDSTACTDSDGKIGLGCYLDDNNNGLIDDNECKKGKYVCDSATKTLKCEGDGKILDFCCADDLAEFADGKIGDKPFTIIKAKPEDIHLTGGKTLWTAFGGDINLDDGYDYGGGIKGGFNCDEVCKKAGKICVGIGLTDPSKNACVYEVHDESGRPIEPSECKPTYEIISASLSQNQKKNNCKAYFGFLYYSKNNEHWSTAFDKYETFCAANGPRSAWQNTYINTVDYLLPNSHLDVATPDASCGTCKPKAAPGEKCTGNDYKQDPSDSCDYHGTDLGETGCYCY